MTQRSGIAKHHPVKSDTELIDRVDWYLRNLWETPEAPGLWRMIQEIPETEHRRIHGEKETKKEWGKNFGDANMRIMTETTV